MSTAVFLLQIELIPELRPSPSLHEDWMPVIFLIALLSLAYVRIAYQRRLQRLFSSLARVQILRQVMREELVFSHRASVLLFMNFVLLTAMILYLAFVHYGWQLPGGKGAAGYGVLAGAVALIYIGKLVLGRAMRTLLDEAGLIREYLFEVFLVNKALGLFALPLAVALAYLNRGNLDLIFSLTLFLGLAALVFRVAKGLILSKAHRVSRVYIILYLCTLELLPLAVLVKAMQRALI